MYPGKNEVRKYVLKVINEQQGTKMLRVVTLEEIKDTLFAFNSDKAPGLDSFKPYCF